MLITTIVGARPQFVKAAVVSRVLRSAPGVRELLIHTGQHYDGNMSDIFFSELGMPRPDFNLGVGSAPHGVQTARILQGTEEVLIEHRPDLMLVYGDTNSTLAGALAAVKLHIPVAHVEAGLRSWNRRMPEEINRVLTDHASDFLFAPTRAAVSNLLGEGISPDCIFEVGDVMYDAALLYGSPGPTSGSILETLGLEAKSYVLATIHRAENTDSPERLTTILNGLRLVAREVPVVVPLHPRTRAVLTREGMPPGILEGLRLIEPVGYLAMMQLEKGSALIVTDSGGVQKEAYFHRVACVTLRDETEWTELLTSGWNHLCPPREAGEIARTILAQLGGTGTETALYGDGHAAEKIAAVLLKND